MIFPYSLKLQPQPAEWLDEQLRVRDSIIIVSSIDSVSYKLTPCLWYVRIYQTVC